MTHRKSHCKRRTVLGLPGFMNSSERHNYENAFSLKLRDLYDFIQTKK